MKQGNFGILENRETGERMWGWKVYDPEQGVIYVDMLSQKGLQFVQPRQVDDSASANKLDKEWRVIYEMQPKDALQYISLGKQHIDALAPKVTAYDLNMKLQVLLKRKDQLQDKLTMCKEDAAQAKLDLLRCEAECDQLSKELQDIEHQALAPYCYVYGQHMPAGREFCWYADKALAERIKPGMSVQVDTAHGLSNVFVTRVETSNVFAPHKHVLGIVGEAILPF